MRGTPRCRGRHAPHRPRHKLVVALLSLALVMSQSMGIIAANAARDSKDSPGRSDSSHGDTKKVNGKDRAASASGSSVAVQTAPRSRDRTERSAAIERPVEASDIAIDWIAAGPFTYDHSTLAGTGPGLPAYDGRVISETKGVVESLEGGDFACNDKVLFFAAITVLDDPDIDAPATLHLSLEFANGPDIGYRDLYGAGVGANTGDSAHTANGNETATATSNGPISGPSPDLTVNATVTNLEGGERFILRVPVILGCGNDPGDATGNLSARVDEASVGDDRVNVGTQTITLKSPAEGLDILPPPTPPQELGIHIEKGGPALVHVGDTITYRFAVTLTTETPLTDVEVTDPECDTSPTLVSREGGNNNDTLQPGETWNYRCDHVVTANDPDPLPNTATATGTAPDGSRASDQDSHVVDIIHPDIQVVKTANPISVSPGQTVAYTYVTTNTGDTTLFDVRVTDDKLGHICTIPQLDVGESHTCTATLQVPQQAGPIDNIATAEGEDVLGMSVRDRNPAHVTVVLAGTITPPTTTPPGGLPFTGAAGVIPLAGLALLLFLAGSGLLFVTRRREDGSEN